MSPKAARLAGVTTLTKTRISGVSTKHLKELLGHRSLVLTESHIQQRLVHHIIDRTQARKEPIALYGHFKTIRRLCLCDTMSPS